MAMDTAGSVLPALLSRGAPDSPRAPLRFPHQQPAPASECGGKGGNGAPKSDLYNLLVAPVKGLGAKRLKLMTTVSLCISCTTNSFFQPSLPPLKIKHGKLTVSYGPAITFFITISSCFVDKTKQIIMKTHSVCSSTGVTCVPTLAPRAFGD